MANPDRAKQLASEVLKLPASEQAAWLARACGHDAELLREVESELANRTREGDPGGRTPVDADLSGVSAEFSLHDPGLTHSSAPGALPPHSGSQVTTGTVIAGRYRLLQVIGEGGMGAVWLADQTEPVRRKVAVKLIRSGADSSQVIARFEAERQALAVMDHPHIAGILDGGTFEPLGLPFFVMELVRGIPITRYCDQNRLTLRERLALFIPVCEAIQHAHQKGIIHRDIKPSNILVAVVDGRAVPKVIDFGVAKATGQALTDRTLNTAFGDVVGTPQYMSPEQASADQLDIDTRTDVYSLGVVLYELLTGSLPFDRKRLGRAAIFEILRIIREEDPSTPSSKLSTDEGLPSISANRHTEPARLTRMVRGELDWIVMKSLEKDRTRRYDSASRFAEDVQRFLSGEPVLAAPPSRWYRMQKFLRRNRGPAAAAGLVAVSLVAGIVGTSAGMWQARTERNSAVKARESEAEQRRVAEESLQRAFLALQSFTDEFVERQFASRSILTPNDRVILQKALAQWQYFADSQGDSDQARTTRAEGLFRVARLQERLGEHADSAAGYRQAVEILSALAGQTGVSAQVLNQLVDARIAWVSRLKANDRNQEALAQLDAARDEIQRALQIQPGDPKLEQVEASVWSTRGVVLRALGQLPEARDSYARAGEIQAGLVRNHPDTPSFRQSLAVSQNNRGNFFLAIGEVAAAELHYRQGLELRQALVEAFPEDVHYREELADSHYGLGDLQDRQGRNRESLAEYSSALALVQQLHAELPLVPDYRVKLADLHFNVAGSLDKLGDQAGRLRELKQAVALQEKLAADFPAIQDFAVGHARARSSLGRALVESGQTEAAQIELDSAVESLEKMYRQLPQDSSVVLAYTQTLENLAHFKQDRGDLDAVRQLHQQSAGMLAELLEKKPGLVTCHKRLVDVYWNLAGLLLSGRDPHGAIAAYRTAGELQKKLVELQPEVADHFIRLARLGMLLGSACQDAGDLKRADEAYADVLPILEKLASQTPDDPLRQLELAGGHTNQWLIQSGLGAATAPAHLEAATQILEKLAGRFPDHLQVRISWYGNLVNRCDPLIAAGDQAAAVVLLDQAIEGLERIVAEDVQSTTASAFLLNALQRRAPCLDHAGRHLEAAADWATIAERLPPGENTVYRSKSAQSLVRGGENARAIEIADSLAEIQEAPTIFARARIHALAFGNAGEEAQALRSVELLAQLVKMGLDDVPRLRKDPDLKSLQKREDFLDLLRSIQN